MSLITQIDLVSKSSDELRGLLAAAFMAAAQAEPGSKAQFEAQALVDAIKFELAVRAYTM